MRATRSHSRQRPEAPRGLRRRARRPGGWRPRRPARDRRRGSHPAGRRSARRELRRTSVPAANRSKNPSAPRSYRCARYLLVWYATRDSNQCARRPNPSRKEFLTFTGAAIAELYRSDRKKLDTSARGATRPPLPHQRAVGMARASTNLGGCHGSECDSPDTVDMSLGTFWAGGRRNRSHWRESR
jgi:hypothetical protein